MTHLCTKPFKIGPSILNADLSRLADICNELLNAGADYLHLDVMDGHFVPNITFGHPVVAALKQNIPANTFLDMHMMVLNPEKWVNDMKAAGASQYTFHLEATSDAMGCIHKIREADMKVKYLRERYEYLDIEVDGGVGLKTIRDSVEAGANMIVSGSEIVNHSDPSTIIKMMRATVDTLANF